MAVYVIGAESSDLVKIGYAFEPTQRLTLLQTGSPLRLEILATLPGDRTTESALHRHFDDCRQHGEWFDFGDADPVQAVAQAWLSLNQAVIRAAVVPETGTLTSSEELVAAVRAAFADGEEFLATDEILLRIMVDGPLRPSTSRTWRTPTSARMGLAANLKTHGIFSSRPMIGGEQRVGYYREDV